MGKRRRSHVEVKAGGKVECRIGGRVIYEHFCCMPFILVSINCLLPDLRSRPRHQRCGCFRIFNLLARQSAYPTDGADKNNVADEQSARL